MNVSMSQAYKGFLYYVYLEQQRLNSLMRLRPFYSDFISLLDNYEMSTGVSETVTSEELKENKLFIDAIVETDVMKVQRIHRRA